MDRKIKILGFGGSLRKGSYSMALLDAAKDLIPENAELEIFDKIGSFSLFSQELEKDVPEEVKEFKAKIKAADAILISTPEYNYSIPGYLKNAIDWASRPYGDNSFDNKPAALMSSSMGLFGGLKAQYHLRQVGIFLNLHYINKPEVMVGSAHEKIKDGKVTDEKTKEFIKTLLAELVKFSEKLK